MFLAKGPQRSDAGEAHKLKLEFISLDKPFFFQVKVLIFHYPSVLAYVLGAQKNRLIDKVLLNTHSICLG